MALVKEYAEQIRGVSYKPEDIHDKLDMDSIALLRANNITDDGLTFEDLIYVDKSKVKEHQILKKGDILICASSGSKALVGKAAYVPKDINMTFGAFCKVVRPHTLDSEFFQYFFQSPSYRRRISDLAGGANINNIRNEHIDELSFPLPDLATQRRIADTLDMVTEGIAICKQMLSDLDALVKSRFVEMFGDLRTNPKNWEIRTFDELTELITDGEHNTPRRVESGIYLLSARNVLNHALQLDDVDYIDQDEYDRIAKRVIPQAGDVLISCSGTVGRCCSVPDGLKFQMVRSAALLRFKPIINPIYAEYLITSDDLQEQINSSKTASSQANLFQGKIAKLKGFVPPIELQNEFLQFARQVDKSKAVIQQQLTELEKLKKSLMQEYFE